MSEHGFTHFDETGKSHMVDVSEKVDSDRIAIAEAIVRMQAHTREQIEQQAMKKGDVLAVSELAGIMAAKKTSDLIPLCHQLPLTKVSVDCDWTPSDTLEDGASNTACLRIRSTVKTTYRTGVEMEALTACSVAALTVYDMCKAIDKAMTIESIRLVFKSGGKSGTFGSLD